MITIVDTPQIRGSNYIKYWTMITNEELFQYLKTPSYHDMLNTTKDLLSLEIPEPIFIDCITTAISNSFNHWINYETIILKSDTGNEYTVPIDTANSVQLLDPRPLSRCPIYESLDLYKTGQEFIEKALAREPVMTTYVSDLKRLHAI